MSEERVRLTIRALGLSEREWDYSFKSWKEANFPWKEEGIEATTALFVGAVRCIWVSSAEPGTGKTGFAVSVVKRWADEGKETPQIVRMPLLSTGSFEDRKTALVELPKRGLVVLDDLHRMRWTEQFILDWWFNLSDALYLSRTRVIVTANTSFDKLRTLCINHSMDYRAAFDRFKDGGIAEVEATGTSVRM